MSAATDKLRAAAAHLRDTEADPAALHRAAAEPPRRCPEHEADPEPPPCGPCADARHRHDQWQADQAERARTAPRCDRHRGQPAHNCALCRAEQLAA